MTKTSLLSTALFAACLLVGCGAPGEPGSYDDETPVEETSETSRSEQALRIDTGRRTPSDIFDCSKEKDKGCYECGNKDGVICCIFDCIVINQPRSVESQPLRGNPLPTKAE